MNIVKRKVTSFHTVSASGLAAALLAFFAFVPAGAQAAPSLLSQFCDAGEATAQCHNPGGVATDPNTGDVYIADAGNDRVQEFTIWGEFVRTFGGGVVVGGGEGTGDLASGSNQVTAFEVSKGSFREGETIEGAGIAPGTTIASVGVGTLTLSKPAIATAAGVVLAVAEGAGHVPLNEVQRVAIEGSPSGGTFALTLAAGTTVADSVAGSNALTNTRRTTGSFHVGDRLSPGALFPSGAEVVGIGSDGSLSVSTNSTQSSLSDFEALETTAPIPFNATAAELQEKLEALPAIGPGAVAVGGPTAGPYSIEFKSHLADLNLQPLRASGAALSPAGSVNVKTTSQGGAASEVCNVAADCRPGVSDEGADGVGQFRFPNRIARDSSGDLYVGDAENLRVQKFDSEGNFLLMFGGGVNRTKVQLREEEEANSEPVTVTPQEENVCTGLSGDICGPGSKGSGNGQFGEFGLAVGPNDEVYVRDGGRIQRFGTDGTYKETILVPGSSSARLALAVDPSGNIYASIEEEVVKLSPAGTKLGSLSVKEPGSLATDLAGNVYVVDGFEHINNVGMSLVLKVRKFDAAGTEAAGFTFSEAGLESSGGIATNSACGLVEPDLYVTNGSYLQAFVRAYGPPPDATLCPPPSLPPTISAQFSTSTDSFGAILKARINPNFWPDTTYYVEYGTGKCSEGGCDKQQPAAPGGRLTTATTNQTVTTPAVTLTGLEPGTEYHYRFVATSGGGGPVRGVGGEVGKDGSEATFTTAPSSAEPKTNCPNQTFRLGGSATLPDCRAYEMVSPVDKNGGNVASNPETRSYGPLAESAADGNHATFSSLRAFADPSSSPLLSQYLSSRGPGGWTTQSISPPRASYMRGGGVSSNGRFNAFSEDLCTTWVFADSSLPLVPEAPAGYSNLYRRDNCAGEPSYELLSNAIPFGIEPEAEISGDILTAQGFSADHSHTVFLGTSGAPAPSGLTKDACSKEESIQLYESNPEGGPLRLVSTLPNGKAACGTASAGTGADFESGFEIFSSVSANAHDAISPDGSRVFWTKLERINGAGIAAPVGLFMRINATQPQSKVAAGKCTEPERACTVAVAEGFSKGKEPRYWDANPETTQALYTVGSLGEGARLFQYDVETGISQQLAEGVNGVVGSSEDLSRIYLTSKQALSSEPNSEGDKAQVGQSNLYLEESGTVTFIATLGGGGASSPANFNPLHRTSRVSPDGLHLAFTAATQPTGYDNADAVSGEPDTEVFLYDASPGGEAGRLVCTSCNPGGGRPSGRLVEELPGGIRLWAAAELPGWKEISRPTRLLSANGNRLFFQTYDSLVQGDTNGKRDVYEWARADSAQVCEEIGAGRYVPGAGGCLSLISSGQSAQDSELVDASTDGSDVFFSTSSSLLPRDPGLVDLYDARVGGGFPQPIKTAACEGEACQGPLSPPSDPTPGSATFNGAGNVREVKAKKAHKKKHAKKHSKKKQRQNAKKRANHKRRAGR